MIAMSKPSTQKIKNFRRKVKEITDQELGLRAQVKHLYEQFVLDVGDDEIALRHVRLAYYEIQKYRLQKKLDEFFEFHPFFGANSMSSRLFDDFEEDEEDDGLI